MELAKTYQSIEDYENFIYCTLYSKEFNNEKFFINVTGKIASQKSEQNNLRLGG